jgi:5-methylcytosine-specific restriction endonuclease McrA
MDHVMPLARGGHHTYANCKTSHSPHYDRKGARLFPCPATWAEREPDLFGGS